MFKRLLIFAFLFVSLAAFAAPCDSLTNLNVPDTLTACRRDTLRIETHTAFVYEWSDNSKNPFYVFPFSGKIPEKIWVKITDTANSCEPRYDTIIIDTFPRPQVNKLNIDTTLCFGDTLTLKIGDALFTDTALWQTPNGLVYDSVLKVVFDASKYSTGVYSYVATYVGACPRDYSSFPLPYNIDDSVFVFFANRPIVDLGPDTMLCDNGEGLELTALSESNFLTSKYDFLWKRNNSQTNSITVNFDNKGEHIVSVWNNVCNDTVSDTVDIDFWPKVWTESKLISDTSVCDSEHVRLDASVPFPLTTYLWTDDSSNTNPVRIVTSPKTYTVVLTDSAGCQREFSCNFSHLDCAAKLEMPNVFTPNGDGINDLFGPITHEKLYHFRLRIYDRWGRAVFKFDGNPEEAFWNGKNGSSNVADGVYFWVAKYEDVHGKKFDQRGTVTILR